MQVWQLQEPFAMITSLSELYLRIRRFFSLVQSCCCLVQLLCCCLVQRNHLFFNFKVKKQVISLNQAAAKELNQAAAALYQREKPSDSKVKLRQASNHCKRFLKLPNLHLLIKQNSPLLPRSLALVTSGELLIVFSTKVNLLYLLYSTVGRFCLLHLIKQNFMLKIFL